MMNNSPERGEPFSKSPFSSDLEIHEGPMDIQWQDLNVFYNKRECIKFWESQMLHIIKNISGRLDHGTLMAIMGPSGCGKSTLLNALTCRNLKGLYVQGKVFLNGQKASTARLASVSAYVQQNDLFIGALTVEEHLFFQARLKMGHYLPYNRIKKRVDDVIIELGLDGCRKTTIGTEKKSKISGGQKKRLSFASEILTNPPLLFADEPTSGLDSVMAHSVISLCSSLAKKERTVMVTIHQPSSEVFALFDHILLLTGGRLAFMGSVNEAKEFYASLDPPMVCPVNYSIPEFLLSKISINHGKESESTKLIAKICQSFMESSYGLRLIKRSNDLSSNIKSVSVQKNVLHRRTKEFLIIFERCFLIFWREYSLTSPSTLNCFLIAIAIGIVYYRLSMDQIGIMNITGGIFIVLTFMSITPVVDVVYVFVQELQVTIREYDSGLYTLLTYFLCKIIAALPFRIVLPTAFVLITYSMMGLIRDSDRFLLSLMCLIIIYFVATGFGYFISTITSSLNDALLLAPALSIPLVMFAGLPIHLESISFYLKWMRYLSWPFYGFEILTVLQWKGVTNISCPNLRPASYYVGNNYSVGPDIVDCVVDGDRIIERYALKPENLAFDYGMLILMIFVFHLFALFGLYIRCNWD